MLTLLRILEAIIALPKIGAYVEELIDAITVWNVTRKNKANAQAIADAAAFGLRANSKEDRLEASKRWQAALSRSAPR